MPILNFPVTDKLKSIIAHAMAAKECSIPYSKETSKEPALFLVHDQGVYLMSASVEMQEAPDKKGRAIVSYAVGCDPDKDEDWREEARALVGDDDFGETLPEKSFDNLIKKGCNEINIKLTKKTIAIDGK